MDMLFVKIIHSGYFMALQINQRSLVTSYPASTRYSHYALSIGRNSWLHLRVYTMIDTYQTCLSSHHQLLSRRRIMELRKNTVFPQKVLRQQASENFFLDHYVI